MIGVAEISILAFVVGFLMLAHMWWTAAERTLVILAAYGCLLLAGVLSLVWLLRRLAGTSRWTSAY